VTGGMVSDWLLRRGFGARVARARFPGVCVGLAIPFLLAAVNVSSTTLSVACFVAFYFTFSLAVSGYWTMPLELAPRAVGAVGGVMNTAGNFAGLFGPMVAGFIIGKTGDWVTLFYVAAALGVLSSVIFTLLVKTDPIEIPGAEPVPETAKTKASAGFGH
jgi:MFS transporter, ACS family, D-galactonate transporter